MYDGKRILAIIPARGGSKGIPHKNIIDLCGKPLISYTIKAGKDSKYIDYVMVSTDDSEIARISKDYGAEVPFMRPVELAADTSKTIDAIIHAVNQLKKMEHEFDTLVLLQPTEPLRNASDVDGAIEKYFECGCKPLVSISEVDDHPILIRSIDGDALKPLLDISSTCRRQDMPKYYRVNGCIYINPIPELNAETSFNDNKVPYIMDRSHSVDIDELIDLEVAKYYIEHNQ